jgi:murein DD-endopeptidase MepM/ murein hydrolase activator NlpD
MRRPLDSFKSISSTHGQQTNMGTFGKHLGNDYVAPVGTPVKAPVSGSITQSTKSTALGNYYEITEVGNSRLHRLAHLSTRPLGVGAMIEEGQEIAKSGNTGITTGPHVHWDIRKGGTTWNASFDNYYNPEVLVAPTPPIPAPGVHPLAWAVGKNLRMKASVRTWNLYVRNTSNIAGVVRPMDNGGLDYLIRGVSTRLNRVVIFSASAGKGQPGNLVDCPVDGDATIS